MALASLLAETAFLRASLFGTVLVGVYTVYASLLRSKLVYRREKPWTPPRNSTATSLGRP